MKTKHTIEEVLDFIIIDKNAELRVRYGGLAVLNGSQCRELAKWLHDAAEILDPPSRDK